MGGDQPEGDQRGGLVVRLSFAGRPGRRMKRPDIASPRPTEIASMTIATIPKARLASQKSC